MNFQCAEFCPTSHHFRVNGHQYLVNYTEAGAYLSYIGSAIAFGCSQRRMLHVQCTECTPQSTACSRSWCCPKPCAPVRTSTLGPSQPGSTPSLLEHLILIVAGTEWGCADRVLEGVTPNEHGTWHFGRMGWCDGQGVSVQIRSKPA